MGIAREKDDKSCNKKKITTQRDEYPHPQSHPIHASLGNSQSRRELMRMCIYSGKKYLTMLEKHPSLKSFGEWKKLVHHEVVFITNWRRFRTEHRGGCRFCLFALRANLLALTFSQNTFRKPPRLVPWKIFTFFIFHFLILQIFLSIWRPPPWNQPCFIQQTIEKLKKICIRILKWNTPL